MRRTRISLALALRRGRSRSARIREAIDAVLQRHQPRRQRDRGPGRAWRPRGEGEAS